jgi:hypothetical protein
VEPEVCCTRHPCAEVTQMPEHHEVAIHGDVRYKYMRSNASNPDTGGSQYYVTTEFLSTPAEATGTRLFST